MKHLKFTLLSFLLLFSGCLDPVCDPGPFYGQLKVRLTINEENPEVHLVVFQGRIENRDTLFSEYVRESPVYYELDAGKYYSATARYISGIREVIAVDGKTMVTSTDDDGCEYAEDLTLNLRLAD